MHVYKYTFTSVITGLTIIAGIVNHGMCSFLTYPSYLAAFYILLRWPRKDRIIIAFSIALSLYLFFNNKNDNPLFFPAVGKEVIAVKNNLCGGKQYISENVQKFSCEELESTTIQRGEKGKVVRVEVHHNFLNSKLYLAEISFNNKTYNYFPLEDYPENFFKMGDTFLGRTTMENQFFKYVTW